VLATARRQERLGGLDLVVAAAGSGAIGPFRLGRPETLTRILGLHPLPLHGEYCAAKSGLRSLAGTLRLELAGEGVEVLLATLGPVESEFRTALVEGERPGWSGGRGMPPDRAATAILAGLERRQREVVPGWQAKGYAWLARWMPGMIDRWAARRWQPGGPISGATGDNGATSRAPD
jgi:NAD(P)-dependent dehydrogenase (short-subunit alcohol dehydrogenase family)